MLAPNTILQDRYLIVRLLAQGGMGAIYEASDRRLGNTVALKETFFGDEVLRQAFEREARLLARLRHPALPVVSDHFIEGAGQFLVMQYIPGDDLDQMLRKRGSPFAQSNVLVWADQLLDALDYLHTQQPPIIHRDIKPQNLKLTERGQIILLDFGLAKGSASQGTIATGGRSIFGYTPDYAPLEQIKAEGTDARSDLYSLAATLYTLLTGANPPAALIRVTSVASGQPDPLRPASELNRNVKPAVASVLMWAMSQDRNQRPASAAAMRQALIDASRAETSPGGRQWTVAAGADATALPPTMIAQPSAPQPPPRVQQPSWPAPPTSMPQPAYTQPAQKSRAGWWVVGSIAALFFIAVIAAGAYLYLRDQDVPGGREAKTVPAKDPASALTPGTNEPSATQPPPASAAIDGILDRYVEAVGGRESLESVSTRVARGSFELPDLGITGAVEVYAKAPNKLLIVFKVPGVGISRTGFNGTVGWSQDQQTGLRRLSGKELAAIRRDADFYRELRFRELYSSLTLTGKETVNGREAYVVEAGLPEGGSDRIYFDAKTGLIIRSDTEREGLQGLTNIESYFEDYRVVDGITMPFRLRQQNVLVNIVTSLREVRHNVPVNDSIFNPPG